MLIGLEAVLIIVHQPVPGLLGLRVPVSTVGGGLGEFVRVVVLQGRWVQRLWSLLLFFLVHVDSFRGFLIFLLWDLRSSQDYPLVWSL